MKREQTLLFPENVHHTEGPIDQQIIAPNDFVLGAIYKIGRPSSIHFQYLNPTLDANTYTVASLSDFTAVQFVLIKATSVLRMKNGKKIAVFRHFQDEPFLGKFEKIYEQLNLSLSSKEIINLDSETRRKPEVNININTKS